MDEDRSLPRAAARYKETVASSVNSIYLNMHKETAYKVFPVTVHKMIVVKSAAKAYVKHHLHRATSSSI